MKEKVIRKTMALLLTVVLCMGLCTGFTVNAGEMGEEAESQTEQADTVQKDDVSSENLPEEADIIETEAQEPETAENTDKEEQTPESPAMEVMPEASEEPEEQNEEIELSEETERKLSSRASAFELSDPEIVSLSNMTAKQKVTWDCVWFGSYPQAEVVSSSEGYTELDESLVKDGDIIADSGLYDTLKNASGWKNNEITVHGSRYRRMTRDDATCYSTGSIVDKQHYLWPDSSTYHYFKYEPIKWRVLKINENRALLLTDLALDDKTHYPYPESGTSKTVTWETSMVRSWLNGDFIGSAFTSVEEPAIVNTTVVNEDNSSYKTEGGNNTSDQVFLLSESEAYGDGAKSYGFVSVAKTNDEARRCKSSTYAKAMGISSRVDFEAYKGNCDWWLRSPGSTSSFEPSSNVSDAVVYVTSTGNVEIGGILGFRNNLGVRPALTLDLSSNQWSPAGTVCSDGTSDEVEIEIKPEKINLSKTSIELEVGKTETLTAEVLPENASVKTVAWSSENPGIAKVDESGKITAVSAGKTTVSCTTTDGTVTSKCDILVKEPQNNPGNTGKPDTGSNTGKPDTGSNTGNSNTGSSTGSSDKVTNTDIKVSRITLSGSSKKIAAGKKIKLTAEVKPFNAKNKAVTWKSGNTKVATVNSKGVVTLKKNSGGKKVTITATAKDGSKKKATYQITSMKGVVKKVAISGKKTRTLKAGKTLKLTAKVTASNSKQANKTLKWSSSNKKYATVSSTGKVKTKKSGKRKTVTITAAATDGSGKKAAVKIKLN